MTNKLQKGDLLIADPSIIGDETFHRSIIMITAIHEKSPMGFIINKPFDFPLKEVFPESLRDSSAFRIELKKSYNYLEKYGSLGSVKKLVSYVDK